MYVDAFVRQEVVRHGYQDGQHRVLCPACSEHRKARTDPCLSVNISKGKIVYCCHHCGLEGIAPMHDTPGTPSPIAGSTVVPIDRPARAIVQAPLTTRQEQYLDGRMISKATCVALGIFGGTAWIRDKQTGAGTEKSCIGFPYRAKGLTYASKYRSIDAGCKGFTQRGAAQTFWNVDRIRDPAEIVITEGEIDAASLYEAGVPSPISVPNGAPIMVSDRTPDPREDGKYGYIWKAKEILDSAKRIVLFVDNDTPGEALAEELARRIGRHKCWKVTYPDGCKDANDVLLTHGKEVLLDVVRNASPWPVNGLYTAEHFFPLVDSLYEEGAASGASTGFKQLDEIYTIAPGQLTVVTGVPSSGKSEFVDQLIVNLASSLEWRVALCSFENEPRFHLVKLIQKRVGKPFFKGKNHRMSTVEFENAKDWVKDHFTFLYQADGTMADIDSIIERLRVSVMRYGIRGAVIDPYNYIDRGKEENETAFISSMLTKLKLFAQAHDVHIWLIAHPAKMYRTDGGKIPIPTGYDISGSAHFFNKADCGVTVHRNLDEALTEIHTWKVRFQWVGRRGVQALAYDPISTRYVIENLDNPFENFIPAQFDDLPPTPGDPAFAPSRG